MPSDPISNRAMLSAISLKDMTKLKRALATGADPNYTIKAQPFAGGNANPLTMAAKYGWTESFAVLLKAGAKRRAPGGESAMVVLAGEADGKAITELARLSGKPTGSELAESLNALREIKDINMALGAETCNHLVESTFRALIKNLPDKLTAKERVRCAESLFLPTSHDFQFAMGARRALPLHWMEELAQALPGSRRLISSQTPGISDSLQSLTLFVTAAAAESMRLPDIAERLDMAGGNFAIDLGSLLQIRNSINGLAGSDAQVFEAAYARQQKALLQGTVASSLPGTSARPRM